MQILAQHKDVATVEVTPQHLTLHAPDCYDRLGSFAQMNPPIRAKSHQEALWRAVRDGTVTVIGSDHAPHTKDEKARPYPNSPSGMPGVQTTLPLMLNHVNQGRLSIQRLVELLCHAPARIYGMVGKGWMSPGFDGDLTLVDMGAKRTIQHEQMASRCGWTPFDGMEVHGWPTATIIRGRIVMREDELIDNLAENLCVSWLLKPSPLNPQEAVTARPGLESISCLSYTRMDRWGS